MEAEKKRITRESYEQFAARLQKTIESIPVDVIDRTIESLPKLMRMIVKSEGRRIKYGIGKIKFFFFVMVLQLCYVT